MGRLTIKVEGWTVADPTASRGRASQRTHSRRNRLPNLFGGERELG